jgi:hypothetical protein
VERAFKATADDGTIVVNYIEAHPVLVKSKFANASGDNSDVKRLWQSLTNQLNSLGYGTKTVQQWQQVNIGLVEPYIYRDIFLTLNIAHTYSLCSVLKNTGQCMYVIT